MTRDTRRVGLGCYRLVANVMNEFMLTLVVVTRRPKDAPLTDSVEVRIFEFIHGRFVILSNFRIALLLLKGLRRTGNMMLSGMHLLEMSRFPWVRLSTRSILGFLSILGNRVFRCRRVRLRLLRCYALSWLTLTCIILNCLGLRICSMSFVDI